MERRFVISFLRDIDMALEAYFKRDVSMLELVYISERNFKQFLKGTQRNGGCEGESAY